MGDVEGREDIYFALQPLPADQGARGERRQAQFFGLGAESLQLLKSRGRRLAIRRTQTHLRKGIHQRQLAGIAAGADIPGAAARLHRVVDGGASFANQVAIFVLDHKQGFIKRIGDAGVDQRSAARAKARLVLEDVVADQLEAILMIPLRLRIKLGIAAIGAILGEHPIERADCGNCRGCSGCDLRVA